MKLTYPTIDFSGLICGFIFAPSTIGQAIDADKAIEWLNKPLQETDQEFIWLHFNLSEAAAKNWMRSNLELPEIFFETLNDSSRSTRIEDVEDTLIAVINDVTFGFSLDLSETSTLWVSADHRKLVSVRTHPLSSIDKLRVAVKAGESFDSSMSLLIHLMHDQGDVLVKILRQTTLQVDAIEDGLLADQLKYKRANLGKLRRVLVRLQRLLALEPAALFRFLHQPPTWIKSNDLDGLRQSTEEFSLAIQDLAALQERIKLLQEEMAAHVNEQMNRSIFTLTIVTVLALPINMVAGLLGMNVGGIPLAQNPSGFFIVTCIVIAFTLIVGWLTMRKKDDF